jgi:class 3 adenylate cyclase
VTFLFTDIEGSTRRWGAEPESMCAMLAAHDEVLRSAIEGHGGWLFEHTGRRRVCGLRHRRRRGMELATGVRYARDQVATAQRERAESTI